MVKGRCGWSPRLKHVSGFGPDGLSAYDYAKAPAVYCADVPHLQKAVHLTDQQVHKYVVSGYNTDHYV